MNHLDLPFGRCLCDRFNSTLVGVRCRRPQEVPRDDPRRRQDGAYTSEKACRREGTAMRTFVVALLGLIGGLLAGVALFERGPGIELLVIVLAVTGAIVAPVADRWLRGRSK